MVIGTAPLLCIPLVLAGCTWVFGQYLGCVFPALPRVSDRALIFFYSGRSPGDVYPESYCHIQSLVHPVSLHHALARTVCCTISTGYQECSRRDWHYNACGVLILWSGISLAVSILAEIILLVSIGFVLGLSFGIIALIISIPLMIVYIHKKS